MADFLKVLDSEIRDTEQAIKEATIKVDALRALRRKVDSQGANGQSTLAASSLTPQYASLDPSTFTQDSENKTQAVLNVILKYQHEGVKAGLVISEVNSIVPINRNYVYSILNRQKKQGKIQLRRGKYYATLGAFAPNAIGGKVEAQKTETASE